MYIIEGNIGVGKSTFLTLSKELLPQVDIIQEPLECWTKKECGKSLLANFYENLDRWSYTIETLAMMARVRSHVDESMHLNPFRLMERSVYSGHYCFAKNGFFNNNLTKLEWEIYKKWVNFLVHDKCIPPIGFIYLKAEPEVCFSRMRLRNRESEKSVSLDYIKQIHVWHDRFLLDKENLVENLKDVPVLVLDCNDDFVLNKDKMIEHSESIKGFFESTLKIL